MDYSKSVSINLKLCIFLQSSCCKSDNFKLTVKLGQMCEQLHSLSCQAHVIVIAELSAHIQQASV